MIYRNGATMTDTSADCTAVIHHGPGHQGTSVCDMVGKHLTHEVSPMGITFYWTDANADDDGNVYTGYFNESPEPIYGENNDG